MLHISFELGRHDITLYTNHHPLLKETLKTCLVEPGIIWIVPLQYNDIFRNRH